jgi:large subunit ribosomal protein L6
MSRLAKKPITIPEKTEVTQDGTLITVKGPKGELSKDFSRSNVTIEIKDGVITLTPTNDEKFTRSLWGTYASHLINMVHGVNEGYEKQLVVEGVGFKAAVSGKELDMALGFSHPVKVTIPEGLEVTAEKNQITIKGIDKELVGSFAADVRALKKPEPYKGKGIRYADEIIRRKQGKKAV